MNAQTLAEPADADIAHPVRGIVHRTRGQRHGPITRLMSPSDLGELLKPFVFLDLFDAEPSAFSGFGPHPHSGIATHTTLLEGSLVYGDSTGKSGTLHAGSLEWMQAGGGVWPGDPSDPPLEDIEPNRRRAACTAGLDASRGGIV